MQTVEAAHAGASAVILALSGMEVPPDLHASGVGVVHIPVLALNNDLANALRSNLGIKEVADPVSARREILAQELSEMMGFPQDMCVRALRACGDDTNLAAVYLLEGGNVQGDDLFEGVVFEDEMDPGGGGAGGVPPEINSGGGDESEVESGVGAAEGASQHNPFMVDAEEFLSSYLTTPSQGSSIVRVVERDEGFFSKCMKKSYDQLLRESMSTSCCFPCGFPNA